MLCLSDMYYVHCEWVCLCINTLTLTFNEPNQTKNPTNFDLDFSLNQRNTHASQTMYSILYYSQFTIYIVAFICLLLLLRRLSPLDFKNNNNNNDMRWSSTTNRLYKTIIHYTALHTYMYLYIVMATIVTFHMVNRCEWACVWVFYVSVCTRN